MRTVFLLKTSEGGLWSVPFARGLHDLGHEVTFALPATTGRLPDRAAQHGLRVVQAEAPLVGSHLPKQVGAVRRLRRQLLDELHADVVVSHLYASALAGRAALFRSAVPHIFMSAGPLYLEHPAIRAAERALRRLDALTICSSGILYEEYRRLGAPRRRLARIPYVWEMDRHSDLGEGARLAARSELGIDPAQMVFACVAMFYAPKRLVHRGKGIKGHNVLLEAWRLYRQSGGQGLLLVVGGGFGPGGDAHRFELLSRYSDLEGVRWVDTVSDVRPYYQAADVSVSPSLSENLGAPAEASMMGVPSIASRVGGLPELVVDAWNGWLVDPGNSHDLARALIDAERCDSDDRMLFGARARLRAQELLDEPGNVGAFVRAVEGVAARRP